MVGAILRTWALLGLRGRPCTTCPPPPTKPCLALQSVPLPVIMAEKMQPVQQRATWGLEVVPRECGVNPSSRGCKSGEVWQSQWAAGATVMTRQTYGEWPVNQAGFAGAANTDVFPTPPPRP